VREPEPGYNLRLAKEDFKFAAAHFTVFPDGTGELLHGHNFRVRVEVSGEETDAMGLLIDVAALKDHIRSVCDALDEVTLIPEKSRFLRIERAGDSVEVKFGDRDYRLPAADVTLLPLPNVTMELLARLLWEKISPALSDAGNVQYLRVEVEETSGQSCAFAARVGA
jgi:6-pyruvoyltetrahydropterin/6-carboxytetrahydropterin synthase